MSVENLNGGTETGAEETTLAPFETQDDADLGALYDQLESEDSQSRDNSGRFASKTGGEEEPQPNDPLLEGEGAGEGDEAGSSTLTGSSVPLPANWNGLDEDWKKIPADVQAKIAARDTEIHARMSDQGRQISALKPVHDVFEQNKDLYESRTTPDGRPVTPAFAAAFLLEAQRRIDANPIGALVEMATRFGMRDQLRAALNGQIQFQEIEPPASARQNSMTPADVARIVKDTLTEDTSVKAASDEVSRLSKDKPLYSEIAEDDMVHFIHKARSKMGDAASKEAVFNAAYDMAVHADPALRTKAAASQKAAEAAAKDPKRAQDARRATSVNVRSTSSGKTRNLTEDELLEATYDEIQSKG